MFLVQLIFFIQSKEMVKLSVGVRQAQECQKTLLGTVVPFTPFTKFHVSFNRCDFTHLDLK